MSTLPISQTIAAGDSFSFEFTPSQPVGASTPVALELTYKNGDCIVTIADTVTGDEETLSSGSPPGGRFEHEFIGTNVSANANTLKVILSSVAGCTATGTLTFP